jgi:hypothetical protein
MSVRCSLVVSVQRRRWHYRRTKDKLVQLLPSGASGRQLCFAALISLFITCCCCYCYMLLCARGRAQILQCGQAWQPGNNMLTAASMNNTEWPAQQLLKVRTQSTILYFFDCACVSQTMAVSCCQLQYK